MTAAEMVSAACAFIAQRQRNRDRLFIAIDGCAAAGKSTLAKGFGHPLGASALFEPTTSIARSMNTRPKRFRLPKHMNSTSYGSGCATGPCSRSAGVRLQDTKDMIGRPMRSEYGC
jgi:hypothetical protein